AVFGWRQIVKKKVTSAAAILSLALAIGACTSAFRLIDALLLRPLPVAGAERPYAVSFQSPSAADGTLTTYDSCTHTMFRRRRWAGHSGWGTTFLKSPEWRAKASRERRPAG